VDRQAGTVPPSLGELWQRADLGLQQAVADHDHQGIASAVAAFEQAEDLAAQTGDPNHGAALINLVNALLVQAEECYSDAALDKALQLTESHDYLFSDHPLRLAYLGKRGRAQLIKAQRTGDLAVMRRAVQVQRQRQKVAHKRHPLHVECMLDLGVSLIHSSVMADSPHELDEAVAVLTAAKRRLDSSVDPVGAENSIHVTRPDGIRRSGHRREPFFGRCTDQGRSVRAAVSAAPRRAGGGAAGADCGGSRTGAGSAAGGSGSR
jgi:hypothetical protein